MRSAVAALLFLLPAFAGAQAALPPNPLADSVAALVERGMTGAQPDGIDRAIALADQVLEGAPRDPVMLHFKGYAFYRRGNMLLTTGGHDAEAKRALQVADSLLTLSARTLRWPETLALRAAVTGQMIGLSGMLSAVRLGPRANGLMDQAIDLAPENPRVLMLRGVSAFYKPSFLGGGNDKAERDLLHAIDRFASDHPAAPLPAWGHAEAYAWLGQVYAKAGRTADARAAYHKALELAPTFTWVTQLLLPALDRERR